MEKTPAVIDALSAPAAEAAAALKINNRARSSSIVLECR
jgi:hypothetical protein